ncbi:MAG: tRNA (N6-threonylcarbamoyladenosine(37)-N6)-methyltransferase TrmO [Desulfobacterales bacterium]|nr:tRNA (N6-threonylcarbamoyladenosine(37)-N6)-methyltransferase TrmO [Desulfobacterales bacterium]
MEIIYTPIGTIHTPFNDIKNMPIQPTGASHVEGKIEIRQEFMEGLQDLDGFSHIILLYHLHKVKSHKLVVIPFLDTQPRGLFSTRAPKRPNPIGLSVVKLLKIEKNILCVSHLDMLDGTPLLDIKPYVPEFERYESIKIGWVENARGRAKKQKSDDRFR